MACQDLLPEVRELTTEFNGLYRVSVVIIMFQRYCIKILINWKVYVHVVVLPVTDHATYLLNYHKWPILLINFAFYYNISSSWLKQFSIAIYHDIWCISSASMRSMTYIINIVQRQWYVIVDNEKTIVNIVFSSIYFICSSTTVLSLV